MHSVFNPVRVLIGEDTLSQLPSLIQKHKYAVVSSSGFKSRGWNNYCPNAEHVIDTVSTNPTISELVAHIKTMQNIQCDMLVAIGGGSVIDTAKVLSVLSDASEKSVLEFLEGNKDCPSKRYEVVAIPTTAGTGAEVTPFATIWDDINKKKLSLFSPHIFPKFAIIDPSLTLSLGATMTAVSGLDALSHSFESLWNKNATPYSKAMALVAIETILETLDRLLDNLKNLDMRMRMGWASMLGGLCISHTKTALAHSISYPLTSNLGIPHGLASGAFLPEILKFNRLHDQTGIMEEIYHKLSFSKSLDERLDKLYLSLDQRNLFQAIQDNQSIIYTLVNGMINPERSLNNIVKATYGDVQAILDMFFQKSNKENYQNISKVY